MSADEGRRLIHSVAAEGAAVVLLYAAAALHTFAPAVAAAGYVGAGLLAWAGMHGRALVPAHPGALATRPFASATSFLVLGAALALVAVLVAGRLARTPLGPDTFMLSLFVWGLGWGMRLVPRYPWLVALAGWMVAGVGVWWDGQAGPVGRFGGTAFALWAGAAVLLTWVAGRLLAVEVAAFEELSAANIEQVRAYEQEQNLFSLHNLIERKAGAWGPPDWGEQALKVVARLLAAHEVRLLVRAPEGGQWRLYAAWPATAGPDAAIASALESRRQEGRRRLSGEEAPSGEEASPFAIPEACLFLSPRVMACAVRAPAGDEAWGWLAVSRSPWQAPFDPEQRRLMERLVQHWSAAVHNVATYTQNQRRARHLATLHEISRAMARPLQLEPLFETIFREVARVMPVEAFIITLYESETQTLHAAFIVDKGQRYPPVRLPADQGPTVEVIRTGKPLFINRRAEELGQPVPGRRLIGVPEEPASVIIVPMILEERVVGTISAQAYRPGAYTLEDFELLGTIAGQAAIYVQNARLYEQTMQLALTDSMTGLGNARMLRRELARELARARRSGGPLSLIMIDSDDLKYVNDRYGHPAGDRYLVLLADVIRAHVRAGDIVTRYAGDEFVVVLPETSMEEAQRVAARIVEAVAQTPLVVGQEKVFSSISAGVAGFPGCGEDEEQLLWAVDRALYAAKRSGKGRISCWVPGAAE